MRLDIKEGLSAILKFIKETHSGGLRDILKEIGGVFQGSAGGVFGCPAARPAR